MTETKPNKDDQQLFPYRSAQFAQKQGLFLYQYFRTDIGDRIQPYDSSVRILRAEL